LASPLSWLSTGIGGQVTLFRTPANLQPVYGSNPLGLQLFLRLRLVRDSR